MCKRECELELLILRCQRRDREAWQTLAQYWSDRLLVHARHYVQDEEDAWDVVQKTWVRILQGIHRLRDAKRFPAWAYRIVRNTALSHRRAKQRRELEPLGGPGEPLVKPNYEFEDAEAVYSAIQRLSLAHQEVLTVYFLRDLSLEDIGVVLGIPTGTVKPRLHYAKRALRQAMISGGESDERTG